MFLLIHIYFSHLFSQVEGICSWHHFNLSAYGTHPHSADGSWPFVPLLVGEVDDGEWSHDSYWGPDSDSLNSQCFPMVFVVRDDHQPFFCRDLWQWHDLWSCNPSQVRCGTPVRLALSCAVTAASCLWSAIILACGLTFGMLWRGHLLMQGCSPWNMGWSRKNGRKYEHSSFCSSVLYSAIEMTVFGKEQFRVSKFQIICVEYL